MPVAITEVEIADQLASLIAGKDATAAAAVLRGVSAQALELADPDPPRLRSPERVREDRARIDGEIDAAITELGYGEHRARLSDPHEDAKDALTAVALKVSARTGLPDTVARKLILDRVAGGAGTGLLAQRAELGDLMRAGIPRPEFLPSASLGERLFYERALFIVSGHKKSGKSWAMTTTALDCLRAGRPAVYIDFENGQARFARRLLQLGATPDEADSFVYLPFPTLNATTLRDDLAELAEALPDAFVVVDSLRGLIARIGGREPNVNDPQVIERATAPWREAVDAHGMSVAVIDHAKMTGSDTDEYATANSAAKEQSVDAVYFWTKVQPYSREVAGVVKLKTTDDRDGELAFEKFWRVGGQQDAPVRFEPMDGSDLGLGRILTDVRQLIADSPGKLWTKTQIRGAVKGDNSVIDRAIDHLVAAEDEPIYADADGRKSPRFVWDDERDAVAGAAF